MRVTDFTPAHKDDRRVRHECSPGVNREGRRHRLAYRQTMHRQTNRRSLLFATILTKVPHNVPFVPLLL